MKIQVKGIIKDNLKEQIKNLSDESVIKILVQWGLKAESMAKDKCPVLTGRLRNSITNNVLDNEKAVEIGSSVEYATKIELGGSKQAPQGYLRPAIEEHTKQYEDIAKKELNVT